jgi:hypothetical protein
VAGMFKAINGNVIEMADSERSLSGGVCVCVCVCVCGLTPKMIYIQGDRKSLCT